MTEPIQDECLPEPEPEGAVLLPPPLADAEERRSTRRRLNVLVGVIVGLVVVIIAIFGITVMTYRAEVNEANSRADAADERRDAAEQRTNDLLNRRTNFEEVIAASVQTDLCTIAVRGRYDIALGAIVVTAAHGEDPTPDQVVELEASLDDYRKLNILCPSPPEPDANVEGIPAPGTDGGD